MHYIIIAQNTVTPIAAPVAAIKSLTMQVLAHARHYVKWIIVWIALHKLSKLETF